MTKKDLIAGVAETCGLTKVQAGDAVENMLTRILATLAKGDPVQIHGFGTFKPVTRAARTGRNPRTGAPVQIAEKTIVKFVPSKANR